jgi:tetratricopeptide (TPR) repeat protein
MKVLAALHTASARILVGTDNPNPYVAPGFSIHEELQNLVECGFSPYEALKAGTTNAAEFVGASAEWGSVTVGKRADLLLLEANPLDDVSSVSRSVGVMVRGKWLTEEELQLRLDRLAERYKEQERFNEVVLRGDLEEAKHIYDLYAEENPEEKLIGEDQLNSLGYQLLSGAKVDLALEVFCMNAEEHPESGKAWYSLAEAYRIDGQIQNAIQYYEKSLDIDPGNQNAVKKLQELRK